MTRNRKIGLERRDGFDVGRDPRSMSAEELIQMGHERVSPLKALRLKCLDCSNDSAQEVRLCTAVDCPSWPFRMGKNPWRAPLSEGCRAGRLARLTPKGASAPTEALKTQAQIDTSRSDGGRVPEGALAEFSPTGNSDDRGGAS
jgi:hypothetical protein